MRQIDYQYDAPSRLISAVYSDAPDYVYAYDAAGNLTNNNGVTRTFNAANQINGFAYDANGNLTSDGTNSYTWDRANRMLSAGTTSYQYNGAGNRIQQSVGGVITKYLLDLQPGLAVALAQTTNGQTTRFVHAPTGIFAHEDSAGNWVYTGQDGLGSVLNETNAAGAVQFSRQLDPYGKLLSAQGSTVSPYEYTGEMKDSIGLLHLRARNYAPNLGVFTSLDVFEGVFEDPVSLNGYQYAANNPINMIDPSGMLFWAYPSARKGGVEVPGYYYAGTYNAHPVIEYWMEQQNGFWNTQLEFPGHGSKVDIMVFSEVSNLSLPSQSPLFYNWIPDIDIFEIEPTNPVAIVEGYRQLLTYYSELQNINHPHFRRFGILPLSDAWVPTRPNIMSPYQGQPYAWGTANIHLGERLIRNTDLAIARIDPNDYFNVSVKEAYWAYLIVPGLILYVSERQLAKELATLGVSFFTTAMILNLFHRKYREAQLSPGGGILPEPSPSPAPATISLSAEQTIIIGALLFGGLCITALTPIPDELLILALLGG